eukprot:11769586-Karenia_brevis.AAC.1
MDSSRDQLIQKGGKPFQQNKGKGKGNYQQGGAKVGALPGLGGGKGMERLWNYYPSGKGS